MTAIHSSQPIDVEEYFDEFVKEFGGQLIKDCLPKSPIIDNADYLFRQEHVVAELKCFKKDYFRDKEYKKKLNQLYNSWVREGLIPPAHIGKIVINTKDLPPKCQSDVATLVKQSVQRVIKKANKQIRETKEYLSLSNAKGMLLLVNDGNYSLSHDAVMYILGQILKTQRYSSIQSVVYFTVSMRAKMPGFERDVLLWVEAFRESTNGVSRDFLLALRNRWVLFLERKTGEKIPKFVLSNRELLKDIKYIN